MHFCTIMKFSLFIFRPIAYAYIQRAGLIQMEIGKNAVPAGLFRRAAPWGKGGATLTWPDIASGIGGGQWLILPPSFVVTQ